MENERKEEDVAAKGADNVADKSKDMEDENGGAEKEEEEEEDGESESDEEELPLGSVEAPVQILTGKRDRKKVERLVVSETPKTPEKKFEVPVGKGVKLGEIELVAYHLDKFKAPDLKPLHKFLFGKTVRDLRETKRNVRQFSGFTFSKEDFEYTKRESLLVKFTVEGLKELCTILDVEKKGTKDKMMERLMEFGMNPQPSGRKLPTKGRKKSKVKTPKRKRKMKKSSKESAKKKSKAGGDASTASEEDNHDSTIEDGTEGDEEEEDMDMSVAVEDSKPKKTPKKLTPKPKKEKAAKGTPKSKAKSPKKKMAVKTPSKQTKKASPVKSAKKTPQKRKQDDVDDGDSSDDEPLVKKAKGPPTDKELKDTIKSILDGANLEEVTMKMVCRKVYDTFPEFPLQHKKDFIKSTVREIIS